MHICAGNQACVYVCVCARVHARMCVFVYTPEDGCPLAIISQVAGTLIKRCIYYFHVHERLPPHMQAAHSFLVPSEERRGC